MKKLALPLVALSLALVACQTSVLTDEDRELPTPSSESSSEEGLTRTDWTVDKTQSYVSFVGKSNIINHEGKFNDYEVTITPDAEDPSDFEDAQIDVTLEVASMETDAPGLNGHLQKADFFDGEKYPEITFHSTKIEWENGDHYDITGDLTIKGVTKEVTFESVITNEYLTAMYAIPRAEFGIGNDSYGEKLLEDTVPVEVKLVFAN